MVIGSGESDHNTGECNGRCVNDQVGKGKKILDAVGQGLK
jgi:hypothetical protein